MVLPIPEQWRAPYGRALCFGVGPKSLTPWLTGAGSRRLEGTDIGHENGEAMASVGVRLTAQLGVIVEPRATHG